jgi:hypothetical protein
LAVPKTYLTSTKNLKDILTAMQQAQAPKQFSVSFLQGLGYKSSADRLIIGMLKSLGFLQPSGAPTPRYFEFLDQTQSGRVLAEAMREAYGDLFELNTNAHKMTRDEVKNKLKTLTQGQFSDDVLGKMATTFVAFANEADFDAVEPATPPTEAEEPGESRSIRHRRTFPLHALGSARMVQFVLAGSSITSRFNSRSRVTRRCTTRCSAA